ncbi:class V lanthionine synthetase subunit LxmK [Streptomyces sp. NBC_00726]|uniref:class V lanthionine synthetase subunit LxmK n=1 Tax=Streptomyces sp. NBC_00726 TaxID=2903674 RepID=UPI00386A0F2C
MTTTRRRYLTRATDLSQVPAVAAFLRRLGLGEFVPEGLVSHTGRNENWSGTTTSGHAVFVKRLGGDSQDVRRRLRGIIAFEELRADAPGTTPRAPRCLGWSEEDALVAFEMLPLSRTGAELADAKEFDEGHARQIGELIGELHGLKPSGCVRLDASVPSQPSPAAFEALPLEVHRASSAAELRAWSILQQDTELVGAVEELRRVEAAAATCPTHGDLRLDQLLLSGPGFHLLDCEELRLGDPARDTGAFIGEWLHRAVATLPGPARNEPAGAVPADREVIARGARELHRVRPLVRRFHEGYVSTGRPVTHGLQLQSVRYAGWHLMDRVLAQASQSSVLHPVQRAAMGIARTVLLTPEALLTTLGLKD